MEIGHENYRSAYTRKHRGRRVGRVLMGVDTEDDAPVYADLYIGVAGQPNPKREISEKVQVALAEGHSRIAELKIQATPDSTTE